MKKTAANRKRIRNGPALCVGAGVFFVVLLMTLLGRMVTVHSKGGVFLNTEHGNSDQNTNLTTGAQRPANTPAGYSTINTTDFPKGNCIHCHDEHSSYTVPPTNTHVPADYLLFTTNDNTLCFTSTCHALAMATGGSYQYPSYQGQGAYTASAHGTNALVRWPGANPAARPVGDQNKCLNCHNPHGRSFTNATENPSGQRVYAGSDPMPSMLFRMEENLCLNCHDATGPATKDINLPFTRGANTGGSGIFYNHPVNRYAVANDRTPSVHTATETLPLGGAGTALHSECSDCHNPHYAQSGTAAPPTNLIGNVLLGAWAITHGGWPAAGTKYDGVLPSAPVMTPVQLTNAATQFEWQLCLRCHSSYSTLPVYAAPNNVTDISREINPNNPSHHAIAAAGANAGSANANYQNTFRAPYKHNSVITCSDCHESSLESGNGMAGAVDPQGPHGSGKQWILGSFCDSAAGASCANANQTVICFKCHKFAVYYTDASGGCGTATGCSRFPDHTTKAKHQVPYNPFGIWCMNCHGGGIEGGMHGTDAAKGAVGGTGYLGEHFLNGASFGGITRGTGGAKGSANCWSKTAADTYNDNPANGACTQHAGGGQSFTPNYDY